MSLMEQIRAKAKAANKCIVLAEGTEERTLKAADIILNEGIARLILLGNEKEIKDLATQWGLKNIDKLIEMCEEVRLEQVEAHLQAAKP